MGNPQPYRPPSIAEQGGHRVWLNLVTTRAIHNGLGTDDLEQRVRYHVNLKQIAKDFNVVSGTTVKTWLHGLGYVKDEKTGYWIKAKVEHEQDTDQSIKPTEVPGQP